MTGFRGIILFAAFMFMLPFARAAPSMQGQYLRSIQGVLANLGENGAVVASPSRSDPDYFYHWARDAALTMKAIADLAYDAATPASLRSELLKRLDRWLVWESNLQLQQKLTGLGEPRFNLDGTTNVAPWGRPQNDGPALRAVTAIKVAQEWIREGRIAEVRQRLYAPVLPANTLIKRDLEYVAHHWRDQSIDLWEEERGLHYYTLVAQKSALKKGAALARVLDDPAAGDFYELQSQQIESFLRQFYDPVSGILRYAIEKSGSLPHKRSPLDVSVILAAIQTYDGGFEMDPGPVVATLRALIAEFLVRYPVNQNPVPALGPALGRYPEDIYDGAGFSGGNPWFLSTLAAAELYCDLARSGRYTRKVASDFALPQFQRVLRHLNEAGDMSEQFSRTTGFETGARHLTWSYVAYITAYRACFL